MLRADRNRESVMADLNTLTERLAAATASADADDLSGLAALHTLFQDLERQAGEKQSDAASDAVRTRARQAGHVLESIILHEVEDDEASLRQIEAMVTEIQQVLDPASRADVPLPAPTVTSTPEAPTSEPAPASIDAEPTLGADDVPLVLEFITEANGHIESAEAQVLKLEEHPEDSEAVNAIFRGFHTIKGVAGFLNLRQIGSLAHAAESMLDKARKGELKLSGAAIDLVLEAIDRMKMLVADLGQAVGQGRPIATIDELPDLLIRLRVCADSASVQQAHREPAPTTTVEARPAAAMATPTGPSTTDATVKVATDRLDNLINMVGELVIAESMVRQDVGQHLGGDLRLARDVSHLGKITRSLQELSMSMRMVPIQGVFQKMARLVRDLSRKAMKQVEFVSIGGETELDRNVVEAIGDPLVHMVRNSVDHGIESPEERTQAGKPASGRVELRAHHQAGNIVIEIRDDGKGLNRDRIFRKAVDAGLVREDQTLTDQEVYRLIFHAGLSTAEKVTDISGRGVGMDVVRRNIEALRGRIEIASTPGVGSTFTICLPLTLAVIDGLVVKVGTHRYILPLTSIEQSLRPTAAQIATVQGRGEMCMMRGELLPLVRLHRLFNVRPLAEDPTAAIVVIVQDNQRRCGILVDELLGQQQVVIKSLGELLGSVPGISGGAILGDGNVSMILDVPGLIDLALNR